MSLEGVAAIRERAAAMLARRWPRLKLTIAANPRALDDETVLERVLLTAARRRLFVHHVTIQRVGERITVSLDLEVDGRMTLGAAHDVASGSSRRSHGVRRRGRGRHPHRAMETREISGEDADAALTAAVAAASSATSRSLQLLRDVHDVRLRTAEGALYGVFHCRVDRRVGDVAVHAEVDALERAARRDFPAISRIIGHAEPV